MYVFPLFSIGDILTLVQGAEHTRSKLCHSSVKISEFMPYEIMDRPNNDTIYCAQVQKIL